MIFRRGGVVAVILLAGCTQRDNPFDPVNLGGRGYPEPDTRFAPVPHEHNIVVWPDSVDRSQLYKPYRNYTASIQSLGGMIQAGDTIWVKGDTVYDLRGGLTFGGNGNELNWVVIHSFRGQVRFREASNVLGDCMTLKDPYVKIVGLSFSNCRVGIRTAFAAGPVALDSVKIDISDTGFAFRSVGDVRIRHVEMTEMKSNPPFVFAKESKLDTFDFKWSLRK